MCSLSLDQSLLTWWTWSRWEVCCLLYIFKTCSVGILKVEVYILANVTLQVLGYAGVKLHQSLLFGIALVVWNNQEIIKVFCYRVFQPDISSCRFAIQNFIAKICMDMCKPPKKNTKAYDGCVPLHLWIPMDITPDSPNLKFLLVCVCACIDNSIIMAHETSILSYEWRQYNYILSSVQSFWYMYYN